MEYYQIKYMLRYTNRSHPNLIHKNKINVLVCETSACNESATSGKKRKKKED